VSVLAKEKNEKLLPTRRKELFHIVFYVYFWRKKLKIKQNYYVIYYFLNFLENYVELLERGSIMKI